MRYITKFSFSTEIVTIIFVVDSSMTSLITSSPESSKLKQALIITNVRERLLLCVVILGSRYLQHIR